MYYAQLQGDKVICLSNLSGEVVADNMIQLQGDYSKLMGSKYENGIFKMVALNNQFTIINTIISIPITYKKFDLELGEYITDATIYKDVEIYLDGNLIGTETILNGQGIIEFESAEIGAFKITVEGYSCEVIVE